MGEGDEPARPDHSVAPQAQAGSLDPVMIDAQAVRGGRFGPTFHNAGCRGGHTIGAKRSILVEILGLPIAVGVDPAKPHDVRSGQELLGERLPEFPNLAAIVADRGYRGLAALASRNGLRLDIKAPPKGTAGFTPLAPLYRVEAHVRAPGSLATAVTLLRGHEDEREGLARSRGDRLPDHAPENRADMVTPFEVYRPE
jgi:Transposase DDE domain